MFFKNMVKFCCLLVTFISKVTATELFIDIRADNELRLPSQFHLTSAEFNPSLDFTVDRIGLHELPASGSGQFSRNELLFMLKSLPKKEILIVDLRREFHGFINGQAVSWRKANRSHQYNEGLTFEQIEKGERDLLEKEVQKAALADSSEDVGTLHIATERELVHSLGINYVRIPIIDHLHPANSEVDTFVQIVKSLSDDAWLHFHCAGGFGRTTTLLTMLDMMHNSRWLSAEDIMKRQHAIGGQQLYDPEKLYQGNPAQIKEGLERRAFLVKFHQYCLENPNFSQTWSSWVDELKKRTE